MNSFLKRIFLFLLTNLIVVLTIGIILSLTGINPRGIMGLLVLSFAWRMGGAFISLLMSKWLAKRAYGIQLIDPAIASGNELRIYQMVKNLSQKNNIPVPEVGIYNSPEPNAFATGATKNSSMVAFSTGLLGMMNDSEIEAVAGHEISHISNGDMVTTTLLTGIANAFAIFMARIIAFAIDQALRKDDDEGGLGYFAYSALVYVLEFVLMLLAYIPISAFSRYREYKADAGSARLTSPAVMANALVTLGSYTGVYDEKNSFSIAKISSKRRISLYSTHPSIEDRIERLKAMVQQ